MNWFNYVIVFFSVLSSAQSAGLPPLPLAVTNNAVTTLQIEGEQWVASFNGLTKGKQQQDVSSHAFLWNSVTNQWVTLIDVPGSKGRLASQAVSMNKKMWVIGGYSVATDKSEVSTPEIFSLSPPWKNYQLETKLPTPVDDSVAVTFHQRYLMLVSGWYNKGNVDKIQIYDTHQKAWKPALKFAGHAVFGHSGALLKRKLLIVDGVGVVGEKKGQRQYATIPQVWLGEISDNLLTSIKWKKMANHPGKARYRMAALALSDKNLILFVGGTSNPYNYNGVGYNGKPSEPEKDLMVFDLTQECWLSTFSKGPNVMDLRGAVEVNGALLTVGGMGPKQTVLKDINRLDLSSINTGNCLPNY